MQIKSNENKLNPVIGCVIMAAGNASRFGDNKLLIPFEGKPLIKHTFDSIPVQLLDSAVVVTRFKEIESLAGPYGFRCIRNDRPEDGISRTIRLGTEAVMERSDAILYLVSDQPRIRRESIEGLIRLFLKNPDKIVSASYEGKRGNPSIFPKKHFPALLALSGDTGGSAVIRSNQDDLILFEMGPNELSDVDTREDLNTLRS